MGLFRVCIFSLSPKISKNLPFGAMDIFSIKGPWNIMKSWNKIGICRSRVFVAAQDCWSPAAVQAQLPRLHFPQIFSTVPYFDHHFPSFINLIPVLLLPKLRLCCWTVAAANQASWGLLRPDRLQLPQWWRRRGRTQPSTWTPTTRSRPETSLSLSSEPLTCPTTEGWVERRWTVCWQPLEEGTNKSLLVNFLRNPLFTFSSSELHHFVQTTHCTPQCP